MRFEFKPSFDRSVKIFHGEEKEEIKKVTKQAVDVLSHSRKTYKGLGLKRIRENFWEVRKGLKVGILFRWSGDLVEFILAGDHNTVKRYLKRI